MSNINLVLILLAGGIGTRTKRKISKQMIKYNNLTILEVNIINFSKIFKNIPIQIVTNNKDFIVHALTYLSLKKKILKFYC